MAHVGLLCGNGKVEHVEVASAGFICSGVITSGLKGQIPVAANADSMFSFVNAFR